MFCRTATLHSKILAHLFPGGPYATNPLLQLCAENALSLRPYVEGKGHELVVTTTEADFDRELPSASFVITTPTFPVNLNKARLDAAKKLEVLCTAGVGSSHIDISAATSLGLTVLELTGVNAASYANHVVSMALTALRNAPGNSPSVLQATSTFDVAAATSRSLDITNRTVGVLGSGRVGYRIMMSMASFDTQVIYHDKTRLLRELEVNVGTQYLRSAKELASESDIIIATVPKTKWTEGLIDESFLAACSAGAIIVNASFAELVDVPALEAALASGHIGGYATDCWPGGKPCATLQRLPNTTLWAPTGGATLESQESIATGVQNMVERFISGRNYPEAYCLAHKGLLESKSLEEPV